MQEEPAEMHVEQQHEARKSGRVNPQTEDGSVHTASASTGRASDDTAEQHDSGKGKRRRQQQHPPRKVVHRQEMDWTSSDEDAAAETRNAETGRASSAGTRRERHAVEVDAATPMDSGGASSAAAAQSFVVNEGEASLEVRLHARPQRARRQMAWHGVVPDPGPTRKRKIPGGAAGRGQSGKAARTSPAQRRADTAVATRSKGWQGTYMMRGTHGGGDLKYQIKLSPAAVAKMERKEERDAFGDG